MTEYALLSHDRTHTHEVYDKSREAEDAWLERREREPVALVMVHSCGCRYAAIIKPGPEEWALRPGVTVKRGARFMKRTHRLVPRWRWKLETRCDACRRSVVRQLFELRTDHALELVADQRPVEWRNRRAGSVVSLFVGSARRTARRVHIMMGHADPFVVSGQWRTVFNAGKWQI
jgi:hypothetical protein